MGTEKKVLIKRKHNRIAKMREHAVMEGINWTLEGNIKVHKNKKKKNKKKNWKGNWKEEKNKERSKYCEYDKTILFCLIQSKK